MSYCAECGKWADAPVIEAVTDEPDVAEAIVSADVEIARINADRDVTLARIGAGVDKHVATVTSGADAAADAAVADVLTELVTPPEPDAPADVTVVVDPPDGGGQADDGGGEPPVIEPAAAPSARGSNPWW
jgi:hypothetical protein